VLFSFVTIHASDGQTDRETDRRTDGQTELRQQYRALHYMQSHGKMEKPEMEKGVQKLPKKYPVLQRFETFIHF